VWHTNEVIAMEAMPQHVISKYSGFVGLAGVLAAWDTPAIAQPTAQCYNGLYGWRCKPCVHTPYLQPIRVCGDYWYNTYRLPCHSSDSSNKSQISGLVLIRCCKSAAAAALVSGVEFPRQWAI